MKAPSRSCRAAVIARLAAARVGAGTCALAVSSLATAIRPSASAQACPARDRKACPTWPCDHTDQRWSQEESGAMQRVLITGAAGSIGRRLRADMQGLYPILRLSDRDPPAPAGAGEEVMLADLSDLAACETICAGVDGIVHLGG